MNPRKQEAVVLRPMVKYLSGLPAYYMLSAVVWLIATSNVLRTSWVGDDWPNSQTPYWVFWRYGELSPMNVISEAKYWNNQWMYGQGRFYLVHWLESRFAFSYLRSLWSYKIVETGSLFLAGILFVLLIYKLSRSHSLAIITLFTLSITIQFRRDFDPHIAFGFMVPSLMIKIFLASLLAFHAARAKSIKVGLILSFASGFCLFLAMSTYEYAFLMFPTIVISFLVSAHQVSHPNPNEKFREILLGTIKSKVTIRLLPILLSWLVYAFFVFGYLRVKATGISGVYVLGLSITSVSTFITQLFPAWPLTVFQFSDFAILDDLEIALLALTAAFATFILYLVLTRLVPRDVSRIPSRKKNMDYTKVLMFLLAFGLLASPGFMLSIQREWWGRATFDKGYLGILIQEFGVALLIGMAVSYRIQNALKDKVIKFNPRSSRE
jgi:hypothetical protein